jgi:hypothetical protein
MEGQQTKVQECHDMIMSVTSDNQDIFNVKRLAVEIERRRCCVGKDIIHWVRQRRKEQKSQNRFGLSNIYNSDASASK